MATRHDRRALLGKVWFPGTVAGLAASSALVVLARALEAQGDSWSRVSLATRQDAADELVREIDGDLPDRIGHQSIAFPPAPEGWPEATPPPGSAESRATLLRYLYRVVHAGIFGIPAEESARLRALILAEVGPITPEQRRAADARHNPPEHGAVAEETGA